MGGPPPPPPAPAVKLVGDHSWLWARTVKEKLIHASFPLGGWILRRHRRCTAVAWVLLRRSLRAMCYEELGQTEERKFGCTSIYKTRIAERPVSQTLCRGTYGSNNVRRIFLNEQHRIRGCYTIDDTHQQMSFSYSISQTDEVLTNHHILLIQRHAAKSFFTIQ